MHLSNDDCLRLTPAMLGLEPTDAALAPSPHLREGRRQAVAAFERGHVRRMLSECDGNVSLAARRAGPRRPDGRRNPCAGVADGEGALPAWSEERRLATMAR